MAEPLKNFFNEDCIGRIAQQIVAAYPTFNAARFRRNALAGIAELELKDRARHIMLAMAAELPASYPEAIDVLMLSLGDEIGSSEIQGMAPFLYLPHIYFVIEHGLEHFEPSMRAQYELTKRFSAEFSLRFFVDRYPEACFDRLKLWANDPNPHVRRLVSEGTRPRLPWAPRSRELSATPARWIELLELLKDDQELYVRRSVANHLNDIGKDHPKLMLDTCARWKRGADENRLWLIKHALRDLVKKANPVALELMGFGEAPDVRLSAVSILPANPRIGEKVVFSAKVRNMSKSTTRLAVDLVVHFVKASGTPSPKVFKLSVAEVIGGDFLAVRKTIALQQLTTRVHYPGKHVLELQVNGVRFRAGEFELLGP